MFRIQKKEKIYSDKKPENYNITEQLVGYIYNSVDLSKFKYEQIQFENDLPKLLKQKYFVSANFLGTPSLLVFCKIKDKYYSFILDRQTLSYNIKKVEMNKVKIDMQKINMDLTIYAGSIFDGIYMRAENKDTFMISDVYRFRGEDYTHMSLEIKLYSVIEYLKENYDVADRANTCELSINKIFPIAKTEYFCKSVIPAIKTYKTRGLVFYPEESGTKLIFLFGNEKKVSEKREQRDDKLEEKTKSDPLNKTDTKYINTSKKDVFAILEIKQTENIDVYRLFAVEKVKENVDGKLRTVLKRVKMGLAYVVGIHQSNFCRSLFVDNKNKNILVKCKFNNEKSKWEPMEKIDNSSNDKIPTLIDDIESQLDLVEIDKE